MYVWKQAVSRWRQGWWLPVVMAALLVGCEREPEDASLLNDSGDLSLVETVQADPPAEAASADEREAPPAPRIVDPAKVPALPAERGEITIAAFNVENFFDEHNDPYTGDESTDPKTREEQIALAEAIYGVKADFLGIVEVETQGMVWEFKERYLKPMGYEHVYVGHRDYGRGINNGAMSRVPVPVIRDYHFRKLTLPGEDRYWRFARDVLAFDIEPKPGVTMRIFVAHFKSKRGSKDDPNSNKWRLSEAREVRRIIEKQLANDPDALIALIGDLNDTPDSETIKALLAPGDDGQPVLIDVHADLPADQRITYLREPYKSTIDYMLVSPAMAKLLKPGSAKVIGDETVTAATDHAVIMATFNLPEGDPAE